MTTVAPPKLVPSDLKLASESFYLPWFGQKTRFCLFVITFSFYVFFWLSQLFLTSPSSDWAVGMAWRQVLGLAAATYLIRKRPLWP